MTDQELKDLVARTSEQVAKTSMQMEETDKQIKEMLAKTEKEYFVFKEYFKKWEENDAKYDKMFAEREKNDAKNDAKYDKMFAKWEKNDAKNDAKYDKIFAKWEKNDARYDKMFKKMGDIESNIGYHAEQFFQDIFEERLEFGGIKYDEMVPNLSHNEGNEQIEFDIALVNGNAIALIEVKHRIHPNFVNNFAEDRIGKFRKFFPKFKDYNAYLGIAGFSFDEEVVRRASSHGIGIIRQVGQGVEINAENLKAY